MENVNKDQNSIFADLTFGAGGHSLELIQAGELLRIIAFDQDPDSIANGKELLANLNEGAFRNRIQLIHGNFSQFPTWAKENHCSDFQGILLDVGVSSHQFDSEKRGFSFKGEGPLDMRMNYSDDETPTAADLLNTLHEEELSRIFFEYGEERFSRRIARAIVERRKISPFSQCEELTQLIWNCYPGKLRYGRRHPATLCYQALRIAVNNELRVLEEVLPKLFELLVPGGRLLVISFHSLEDRIVKRQFKAIKEEKGQNCRILTKKPIIPSPDEIDQNPRSRSAKLRVIEKI